MSYSEKLKDPRWQRKRLEVLEKAQFKCEECGDDKIELHVHHRWYSKGKSPWDVEPYQLICLCKECHAKKEALLANIHRQISCFQNDSLALLNQTLLPACLVGPWSLTNFCTFLKALEDDFKMTYGVEDAPDE